MDEEYAVGGHQLQATCLIQDRGCPLRKPTRSGHLGTACAGSINAELTLSSRTRMGLRRECLVECSLSLSARRAFRLPSADHVEEVSRVQYQTHMGRGENMAPWHPSALIGSENPPDMV